MTERTYDAAFNELKGRLYAMAVLVERSINHAIEALITHSATDIDEVIHLEKQINLSHITVDDTCLKLLALQSPFAVDLRKVVAIIKINMDLERMGDQAVNIASNAERYRRGAALKPLVDLPIMFEQVRFMVRESIEAFVKNDVELAQDVLRRDDRVDELNKAIFKDVLAVAKNKPELLEQGLTLILISRNLERLGDHATNIAEDVIFAVSGKDVRHQNSRPHLVK